MKIHIGNRMAEVELLNKEENQVCLLIDGEKYEVDITMLQERVYSILQNGKSYDAELIHSEEDHQNYKVNIASSSYNIQIIDTKAKFPRLKRGNEEQQNDKIKSLMPGKVVHIPIQVGSRLQAGDATIVIEAMKMQNSYKVTTDCIVKEILVTEGEVVNPNQLLIRLDLINTKQKSK